MPSNPTQLSRILLAAAHALAATVVIAFAVNGLDYYLHPVATRARHPLYWELKPGGTLGLRFGYAGATMMTLLLLYSVRKRLGALRHLGSLRDWLHWHIFLGIWGPLLIVLHSSLKVGGLVSISFWSMVVVAASGILGRYLYAQIPRAVSGDELSRPDLLARDERLRQAFATRQGIDSERAHEVLELAGSGAGTHAPLPLLLLRLPFDAVNLRLRVHRHTAAWADLTARERKAARRAALELARSHHQLLILEGTRRLFRTWHVFHKPFALILYTLMIVHVGVAWMTGYGRLPVS